MSTVTTQTRYTPEDLLKMPDSDRYELVDGQLVERPMSTLASYVAGKILRLVGNYCENHRLGWVLPPDTGYQCYPDAPEKVRRPDVSFIQMDRMTYEQVGEEGYNPIAPDLAVKVLSPNDNAYEVDKKIQEYFKAGVRLVWVVNPQTRTVEIHRASGQGTILRQSDDLDGEDVIPGFHCPIQDLFLPPIGATEGAK